MENTSYLCRAVGSFFMVGGRGGAWVKISATMVGWRQKIKKKQWLEGPKAVPKTKKFGPGYKWFKISYLEFLLENIISGVHLYIYFQIF